MKGGGSGGKQPPRTTWGGPGGLRGRPPPSPLAISAFGALRLRFFPFEMEPGAVIKYLAERAHPCGQQVPLSEKRTSACVFGAMQV